MRFIKQLFQTVKEGFFDGWNRSWNPIHHYPQEQERQLVMEHALGSTWTDEEVYRELLNYVSEYDEKMRLNRTRDLLVTVMKHRPALRDKKLREAHQK